MTDLTQLSPEELFTRTLRLFDKKNEANENEDFIYARDASDYEREFKEYMRTLFRNLCQEQVDPVKRNKLLKFVNLRDHNSFSILGYILLLGKHGGLNLYSYVQYDEGIKYIISSSLNADITSVLGSYSLKSKINDLIDHIKEIKKYVPSFQLSENNAKLIGYRMAKDAFKNEFDFPDDRTFPRFTIPNEFVPFVPYIASPPPSYPPPTSQYHPPPPPYTSKHPGPPPPPPVAHQHPSAAYQPPPHPYRNGGTRKNHKRHKKQMRKHASKKKQACLVTPNVRS